MWLVENLLPNLPQSSIIIMDNASYHNTLTHYSSPTPNCSKEKIRSWLEENKIPGKEDCLKVELIEVLRKVAPEPIYEVEVRARQYGHEVIRTPPYHPKRQPLETCWGIVTNEVAQHGDFTMANWIEPLAASFKPVTLETGQQIIKKIRSIGEAFWQEDA